MYTPKVLPVEPANVRVRMDGRWCLFRDTLHDAKLEMRMARGKTMRE